MALSQHDLQQLLESLQAAENVDMVRLALERMLQELIDKTTAANGAFTPANARLGAPTAATVTVSPP